MRLKCLSGHDFVDKFDKFIEAPKFDRLFIKRWFIENENGSGVYVIFNKQFEPLYVGCSKDLKTRLPSHLHKGKRKLEGYFDEVLFIGIKYTQGDPTVLERKYIKKFEPLLNEYRYLSSHLKTTNFNI
ncbi:GIY-YIG nuclease family protein [Bacillus cereus]|nr:GIY-YIG nuclease family protein [Bacillus cereus]MDA2127195.1 GIY-YIG nuclease family protein [Bacillus cereus]MDA2149919.1 GIY-YIG nuclease family protein [Bacillus cereus]MEB9164009.1 GIY-YIG nuclease family protein [Bacillus cereus]